MYWMHFRIYVLLHIKNYYFMHFFLVFKIVESLQYILTGYNMVRISVLTEVIFHVFYLNTQLAKQQEIELKN